MNQVTSMFLQELNAFEGVDAPATLPPVYFTEALDEVRDAFIKAAKRELQALHNIENHQTRDKYGRAKSGWWKEDATGRIQVMLKDAGKIIQLQEGKDAWMQPDAAAGCRFFAGAIEAAERKELDRFLTVKPKKSTKDQYRAYLMDLRDHRRQQQAAQVIGDVSQAEASNG